MVRTILAGCGAAALRQIAAAFLAADLSQLEYYEQITKGYDPRGGVRGVIPEKQSY